MEVAWERSTAVAIVELILLRTLSTYGETLFLNVFVFACVFFIVIAWDRSTAVAIVELVLLPDQQYLQLFLLQRFLYALVHHCHTVWYSRANLIRAGFANIMSRHLIL